MSTTNLSLLEKIQIDQLPKFLHESVDTFTGLKQPTPDNYSNSSDISWTSQEFEVAQKQIELLFTQSAFAKEIANVEHLPAEYVTAIRDCFEIRQNEIRHVTIRNRLLKENLPLVQNIDWKLKWVLGSSKLSSHSHSLLQMELRCLENQYNKLTTRTINFEMNLEMLDCFIKELETVYDKLLGNETIMKG